ncbi:tRNA intron endonuclease [Chlamydoabsidia padenii]|nr:tRNA intron endonuclease [Chlamydoabsidia padenii]
MADKEGDQQQVHIRLCGTKPLVFDCKDVKRLRCDYRIVGSLVGSLPRFPQQNGFYGLPLLLLAEETTMILQNRWGYLVSDNRWSTQRRVEWQYPKDRRDECKYQVYCYLWNQGFFLTCGDKFGGDYLAYPGDPMRYHSHFIIGIKEAKEIWTAMDLVRMGRLATNTKKTFVLATPDTTTLKNQQDSKDEKNDNQERYGGGNSTGMISVDCFSITWAGF